VDGILAIPAMLVPCNAGAAYIYGSSWNRVGKLAEESMDLASNAES
jgi:hypothetical protein